MTSWTAICMAEKPLKCYVHAWHRSSKIGHSWAALAVSINASMPPGRAGIRAQADFDHLERRL